MGGRKSVVTGRELELPTVGGQARIVTGHTVETIGGLVAGGVNASCLGAPVSW